MSKAISIFWFRRDLRLKDNAALFHALKSEHPVLPIFIFDKNILDKLPKNDKRVVFIHQALMQINETLQKLNSNLKTFYNTPENVWKEIVENFEVKKVFANRDYEPYANNRDGAIEKLLSKKNIEFHTFKDQVIFEKGEVLKDDGKPYTVFTPYSKKWKKHLLPFHLKSYPTEKYKNNFLKTKQEEIIPIESMGFKNLNIDFPPKKVEEEIILKYGQQRDIPGIRSTSRLGVHLRFGTISIRKLATYSLSRSETYLNELIWRDFYHMIIHHFPKAAKKEFKAKYENIPWLNSKKDFKAWCEGKTGYPMVDAGMRELNQTGFMHNRVRMLVASFLTKHLLIDWRWGEKYFAEKLLDFDLAANNGGWQWAAGTGCDAAPYFRIFNPESQQKKFDKDKSYIKKWIPEIDDPFKYPKPIVDHKFARQRALDTYKKALS